MAKKLIINRNSLISSHPSHVLYAYGELNQTVLEHQNNGIEIWNGVPSAEKIKNLSKPSLLVLDDLMFDVDDNYLNHLFTRGSHNWNCSVILVCQTLYGRNIRTARSNAHYLVVMKNNNLKQNISTVGHQMFPKQQNFFMDAYNDATKKPYSYLVIDSHPSSEEDERLFTNIFPGETLIKYSPI